MIGVRSCRALALLVTILPTAGAGAQALIGVEMVAASRGMWRGLTRASRPVVQPSVLAAVERRRWSLSAGAWASVELTESDASDLTTSGHCRRLGSVDYWAEADLHGVALRGLDARLGVARYTFHGNRGGLADSLDTTELYAGIRAGPLPIEATLWWDVDRMPGVAVTLEAGRRFPVFPVAHETWSAKLGVAAGINGTPRPASASAAVPLWYASRGVTHVGLSLDVLPSFPREEGILDAFLGARWQWSFDDATRRVRTDRTSSGIWWFEAGLSARSRAPGRAR